MAALMAQDLVPQSSLFSIVASNLTIIGAAVYASGWLYLKHYYSLFDIEVGELELGWHEVLLYSLSVTGHVARSVMRLQSLVLIGAAILSVWAVGCAWPELRIKLSALLRLHGCAGPFPSCWLLCCRGDCWKQPGNRA